jgi:hypothetical protein
MSSTIPPTLYCANHPQTETTLRCNRCEKPICVKCATLTPTGYRCKECVRGQLKQFETSQWVDYPIAFIIAGVLAFLGSLILPRWILLAIIGSPIAGTAIAEAVRFAVRRRRSKRLYQVVVIGVILGCLPLLLYQLFISVLSIGSAGASGGFSLFSLLSYGIYAVLVTSTTYYRLSGLHLRF